MSSMTRFGYVSSDDVASNISNLENEIAVLASEVNTLNGYVNQSVKTSASPTFAGLTLSGGLSGTTITTSGDITCEGNSVNTAINTLNTLNGYVNQNVTTSGSPSFVNETLSGTLYVNNISADSGSRLTIGQTDILVGNNFNSTSRFALYSSISTYDFNEFYGIKFSSAGAYTGYQVSTTNA